MLLIQPSADPTVVAAQIQATATLSAAHMASRAALLAAAISACAGFFALIGAWLVVTSADKDRRSLDQRAREQVAQNKAAIAAAFLAEIDALKNFLRDNDVVNTLRTASQVNRRFYFDPGEMWLKTYVARPDLIGMLQVDVAQELVAYCVEMLNELGRLRWLHRLTEAEAKAAWQPEASKSFETLTGLLKRSAGFREKLRSEYSNSSRQPSPGGKIQSSRNG